MECLRRTRLGTCGWSFPDWKGTLYPAGAKDELAYYASRVHRPQDGALGEWAGFLRSLPSQVRRAFVFVNNQFEGHSPATVARLRRLLES